MLFLFKAILGAYNLKVFIIRAENWKFLRGIGKQICNAKLPKSSPEQVYKPKIFYKQL